LAGKVTTTNRGTVLQRLLTLAALAAAFFLSAGVVMYFAMRGHEVQVPNVVGQPESSATDAIEDLGLRVRVRNSAPHEKIPAGAVSEQSPAAGTTVKTGQIVGITVSTGAPKVTDKAPTAPVTKAEAR
jgi:eukaryotic-like serine/threonine-protein kinase